MHNDKALWGRIGMVSAQVWQHQGWVRLGGWGRGWGVQWKSSIARPVLFSERNGYSQFPVRIGPWRFRLLKP